MGIISKADLRSMGRNALLDCYNHLLPNIEMDDLTKLMYRVTNNIGNWIAEDLGEFVSLDSPSDWYEIISDPVIKELRDSIESNPESIEKVNNGIIKRLMDKSVFRTNSTSLGVKAKTLRPGPIKNTFGSLAYRTALNGRVYKTPIPRGLLRGMKTQYEGLIESQSSARSDFFTQGLLGDTEYGRRKLQLVSGVIQRVHMVDCMNHLDVHERKYMDMQVTDRDLWAMAGLFYLGDDGVEHCLTKKDTKFVGKVLRFRALHNCLHPDPYGACLKCYGAIAHSLPKGVNVGLISSNYSEHNKSQTVMSIKHEDTAAKLTDLAFGEQASQFFMYDMGTLVYLQEKLRNSKISLTIPLFSGNGLMDIRNTDNLEALQPSSISRIKDLYIVAQRKNRMIDGELSIDIGGSACHFTLAALTYIKEQGWSFDERGNFVFDLSNWDFTVPLFEFPLTDRGLIEYLENITSKTIGSKKSDDPTVRSLCMFDDYEEGLRSYFRLSNDRMKVHFSHCQTMAFALSVANERSKDDYRPPLAGETHRVAKFAQIMRSRSLSALYTFEGQDRSILSPGTYMSQHRADHYLDALIIPDEQATLYRPPN